MDLEFYLIHTGNKIATHEHLRTLKSFDTADLEKSYNLAKRSFETQQSELFVEAVNSYALNLKALGFTCDNTLRLLNDLNALQGVKAAKGCGALGSDVLLAIVASGESLNLKKYCQKHRLDIIASHKDISSGLQMSMKESL